MLKNKEQFPGNIGAYVFRAILNPEQPYRRFSLAEYEGPDGSLAIAKRWTGSRFHSNYFRFRNEINFYETQPKLLASDAQELSLQFPRIRLARHITTYGVGPRRILLIEKVTGNPISSVPIDQRVALYEESLAYIKKLGAYYAGNLRLRTYHTYYQILRFPLVVVRALIRSPRSWSGILSMAFFFIRCIPRLMRDRRVQFVHRDLWPGNILVSENGSAVLIDFDVLGVMHPFVDILKLSIGLWDDVSMRAAWEKSKTIQDIVTHEGDRIIFQALGFYTTLFELGMPLGDSALAFSFADFLRTLAPSEVVQKKPVNTSLWQIADSMKGSRRKIIFSSYDDVRNPYYAGGGAIAVHQVAKRLALESDILILTGTYPGAEDVLMDGVQYHRIGTSLFGPKIGQLIFTAVLPWYVMRLQFDVWIESFTPPFSTSCLQLFTRKQVIGLAHMLSGEEMYRKYHIPFHLIERLGLKTYNRFIALTNITEAAIRRSNSTATIDIINNGVDFPDEEQAVLEKEYISFIGRIEVNQKGLDLLLKAYAHIADRLDYKLAIAGTGSDEELEKLHTLIGKLGLQSKVRLFGRVSGAEKNAVFSKSIFTVLPSRHETFSLVALETLAYSLPLLSFDIEGLKWLPDYCCMKIPPFEYELLGEKMLALALRPDLRTKLALQGRAYINNFSWDDVSYQYRESISEALDAI